MCMYISTKMLGTVIDLILIDVARFAGKKKYNCDKHCLMVIGN